MAQLHHFYDASEARFGAVANLWLSNCKEKVMLLVIGKARVALLKQVIMLDLELAPAV